MEARRKAGKGQIMEHRGISYQMEILEERRAAEKRYRLLRISGEELLKYAVAVLDAEGSELALLQGEESHARECFGRIAEGELSSLHLCEVAADFCHAFATEIF